MLIKMTQLMIIGLIGVLLSTSAISHDFSGKAHYLANEGVMIESGGSKLLFDPFFHNNYGHYQLVPEKMRKKIFAGEAPYNNIDAVFVSHAHGDHFSADDTIKYMLAHSKVKLFAPNQAVEQIKTHKNFKTIASRVVSVSLKKDQQAKRFNHTNLIVEAVRIPHAGWPQRAEVENIVFRVGGKQQITVMHMGDADPNPTHYAPHKDFWNAQQTDIAFVPYWFGLSESGQQIMNNVINASRSVGVHVPKNVPQNLKDSNLEYLSKPGEIVDIKPSNTK